MKKTVAFFVLLMLVLSFAVACGKKEEVKAESFVPTTDAEKFWYVMGEDLFAYYAEYYANALDDFDIKAFVQGMNDYVNGTYNISDSEMNDIINTYQIAATAKSEAKSAENLAKAEAFLEENKKKDGIKVTDSGLQYSVVTEGAGPKPTASSTVEVNYIFSLADGTVVQSTYDSGSTAKLSLSSVIAGFAEGVQLMNVGSTYMFYIHPNIGYGANAVSDMIPGNSVLVYQVELVSIVE